MTGDGVNDTLALKDADLGIAMGAGTSAAKSVAEIVLLDNRFATLPGVVAEGRRVIANIERVARLFVTKTVWAATFAVIVGVFTTSYPLIPRQLTVVDALTIGIPGFVLSFEPSHEPARPGFLERVVRFAAPVGIIIGVTSMTVFGVLRSAAIGADREAAQSGTTLVLTALGLVALHELMRPLDGLRRLLLGVLVVMGIGAFGIPFVADFFMLEVPAADQVLPIVLGIVGGWARHRAGGAARGRHRGRRAVRRPAGPPMTWFTPYAPAPDLGEVLACRYVAASAGHHDLLPDGCMDLVWTAEVGVMLCGPDTRGWSFEMPPGREMAGVRFRAGAAAGVFRVDAASLVDRRVGLADVVGSRTARRLADALSAAPDDAARMDAFEALVRRRVRDVDDTVGLAGVLDRRSARRGGRARRPRRAVAAPAAPAVRPCRRLRAGVLRPHRPPAALRDGSRATPGARAWPSSPSRPATATSRTSPRTPGRSPAARRASCWARSGAARSPWTWPRMADRYKTRRPAAGARWAA